VSRANVVVFCEVPMYRSGGSKSPKDTIFSSYVHTDLVFGLRESADVRPYMFHEGIDSVKHTASKYRRILHLDLIMLRDSVRLVTRVR
jgi:hypothetical protein